MKRDIEDCFTSGSSDLSITFSAHLGPIILVRLEPFSYLDILGETVSTAWLLGRHARGGGFVISRQIYDRLGEQTRHGFRWHASAAVYLAG